MDLEKIKITDDEKEAIIKNSPKMLPYNAQAQGWSQKAIKFQLYASICAEENSLLSLINKKLLSVVEALEEGKGNLENKLDKKTTEDLTFLPNGGIVFSNDLENKGFIFSYSQEQNALYIKAKHNNENKAKITFKYDIDTNKLDVILDDGKVLGSEEITRIINNTKNEIKTLLDLKAPLVYNHDNRYFTKAEINELTKDYITANDYYNKYEVDEKLNKKAEAHDTYRKEEVNNLLILKANVDNVFDKEKVLKLFKESEVKLKEYTSTKINDLIGGAPETLDTLKEIADFLQNNSSQINEIVEGLRDKVNKDEVYDKTQIDNLLKQKVGKTTFNNKILEIETTLRNKLNISEFETRINDLKGEINANMEAQIKIVALRVIQEEVANTLQNYYTKQETYSKEELDYKILQFQENLIVFTPAKLEEEINKLETKIRQDISALEERLRNEFRRKDDIVFNGITVKTPNVNLEEVYISPYDIVLNNYISEYVGIAAKIYTKTNDFGKKEVGLILKKMDLIYNIEKTFKLFINDQDKLEFKVLDIEEMVFAGGNVRFEKDIITKTSDGQNGRVLNEKEIEVLLRNKANLNDVYNKTAMDLLLGAKSDKEFTYTKQEVLNQLNLLKTQMQNFTNERIETLIGGAPDNLDTLKEIADYIKDNKDRIGEILNGLQDKISRTEFETYQSLVQQKLDLKQNKIKNSIVLGNKYKIERLGNDLVISNVNTNKVILNYNVDTNKLNFPQVANMQDKKIATEEYVNDKINLLGAGLEILQLIDHSLFREKTNNLFENDIVLKSNSGDSKKIVFQRGAINDGLTDYEIYVNNGNLKIDKKTNNNTTNMFLLQENGTIFCKGKKIILEDNLKTINGNSIIGSGNLQIEANVPQIGINTSNLQNGITKGLEDYLWYEFPIPRPQLVSAYAKIDVANYYPTIISLNLEDFSAFHNVILMNRNNQHATNFVFEQIIHPFNTSFGFKYLYARDIYNEANNEIRNLYITVYIKYLDTM